ncbi:ATP-binding protein [Candidatus Bipolaricaulota bacterium]|nr:ATP-binding protein [Candidatus Bipolaricaulota bacterium]
MAIISPRRYIERQITLSKGKIISWVGESDDRKPKRGIFESVAGEIRKFLRNENQKNVIIVPGLRGIGKTTLLFQAYDHFNSKFAEEKILYLACDDIDNFDLDLTEVLDAYERFILKSGLESLGKDEKVLIFLDEAHYQQDWAQKVKSYSDRSENLLFVVTGPSALSLEITSDLARRKKDFDMFPLNFPEYLKIKGMSDNDSNIMLHEKDIDKLKKAVFGDIDSDLRKNRIENIVTTLRNKYLTKFYPWEPKLEEFLLYGGFPFCVGQDELEIHEDILEVCDRIGQEDLPLVSSVGKSGKVAKNGLNALQLIADNPTFSLRRIAESIGNISRESVSNLLRGYEKAGLIQILKPYGSAKEMTRKANEYYLASPTVQASLWQRVGGLTGDPEQLGKLWETYVVNSLARFKRDLINLEDIFYDYQEGGADFILRMAGGNLVAMEVGWGSKDVRQVMKTLNRVDGEYGIVISDQAEGHREIETEKGKYDLHFLPKEIFMLL